MKTLKTYQSLKFKQAIRSRKGAKGTKVERPRHSRASARPYRPPLHLDKVVPLIAA